MARHKFLTHKQSTGQSFNEFVTELKNLSDDCELGDIKDSLVKDVIICGVNDNNLRERFLREDDIQLTKAIKLGQAAEQTKLHAKQLLEQDKNIDQVKFNDRTPPGTFRSRNSRSIKNCRFCGKSHKAGNCPAYGKECTNCSRRNHFASVCLSRRAVKIVNDNADDTQDNETDDFFIDVVRINDNENELMNGEINDSGNVQSRFNLCNDMSSKTVVNSGDKIKVNFNSSSGWSHVLDMHGNSIEFQIDTGSQVDIISSKDYKKLVPRPKLLNTKVTLSAYNNTAVPVRGKCICYININKKKLPILFMVTDDNFSPIIGLATSEKLGLIQRNLVHSINRTSGIEANYSDCFGEIGCLSSTYHIELDPNVTPVVTPPRKIPHSIKPKLRKEIDRMIKLNIIEPVSTPTDWVNAVVIVEKPNGKLRICLDPRPLNQAIKRHHYQLPTAEEIFSSMEGATVFSKLDASSGYWQIPVDEESSNLLAFSTPFGRYKFKRMPYGIHSASEIFQKAVADIIAGIPNVTNSQDDIIIWGSSQQEHDQVLRNVLDRIRDSGLKLNKSKCVFSLSEISFLGHIISSKGLLIDPKKCVAISEMPIPTSKTELQRFLGMINYIGKFIPNLSHLTSPLRLLLGNNTEFEIQKPQIDAIEELKRLVTSAPILQFFNPNNQTRLKTDASSEGLGALIEQKFGEEWKPIGYASRSLNESEKQYAQIEKEILSIVFGCERFHEYLYGYEFEVHNDHKPLLSILSKPLHKCPPRIQRFYLRLMKYKFNFEHKPGKQMTVADTLSRAVQETTLKDTEIDEDDMVAYVHAVLDSLPISKQKLEELQIATSKDDVLHVLKEYTLKGWPPKHDIERQLKPYHAFQEEISYHMGILLKGDRIIVPSSLRKGMLNLIHQGHFGMVKSKQRSRISVYWPGLDNEIETLVANCSTCLDHRNKQRRETMIQHDVPSAPWVKVATDLFTLNNREYVIAVDYHSKFIEIARLYDIKSKDVIKALKKIFSIHGIPKEVFSDNGPQYTSKQFKDFSKAWDFYHDSSSPEYPQSNGLVEREIQTVKRILVKAEESHEDPYLALLNLNATPLKCGLSPAEMMFKRTVRTTLPSIKESNPKASDFSEPLNKSIERYNQGAVDLKPIEPETTVRIYSKQKKNWSEKGKVIQRSSQPRSYKVQNERKNMVRRNRRDLIPTNEQFEPEINYDDLCANDALDANTSTGVLVEPPNNSENTPESPTGQPSRTAEPAQDNTSREAGLPYKSRLRQTIRKPERYGFT